MSFGSSFLPACKRSLSLGVLEQASCASKGHLLTFAQVEFECSEHRVQRSTILTHPVLVLTLWWPLVKWLDLVPAFFFLSSVEWTSKHWLLSAIKGMIHLRGRIEWWPLRSSEQKCHVQRRMCFIGITERGHAQGITFIARVGKQIWTKGPCQDASFPSPGAQGWEESVSLKTAETFWVDTRPWYRCQGESKTRVSSLKKGNAG